MTQVSFPALRMRRLRRTPLIRELVREVRLDRSNLIQPIFVEEGLKTEVGILSMPGQRRQSTGTVGREVGRLVDKGVKSVILFGIPTVKDEIGSAAYDPNGIVQRTICDLKARFDDELVVLTDVCMCQYTIHGHCGLVNEERIDNDKTLPKLAEVAVSHAQAGADIVAPSAMIDGQVKTIRQALDDSGFKDVAVMAYAAKHASSFFGPFRDAASSTPKFGDRRTYQMDYSNPEQALREIALDIKEGADMIMIKPALPYLDVIARVKNEFGLPVAAYSVSGEYAMLRAAGQLGWLDEEAAMMEALTGIRRAGADIVITYFAKEAARLLERRRA